MDKILVCITPQTNSRRLIDRAAEEAKRTEGELHILNIQMGDSVFFEANSAELLDELFNYGSKKGGIVHALAGDNVPKIIKDFSKKQEITKLILGEAPKATDAKGAGVIQKLSKGLRGVEIIVLERANYGG